MSIYRLPQGFITENQAIQVVYECIYPNDKKLDAFKRIRQRIRKAQLDGDLPEFSSLKVDPDIFFTWALKSKGWGALENIKGLPVSTLVLVTGVECKVKVGEAYAIVDAEGDSTNIQIQNQDLHKALALKEVELKQVQMEIEAINFKDKLHKKRMSEAGKKGGRGKGYVF